MRNASSQVLLLNLNKWHFILMTFCGISWVAADDGLGRTVRATGPPECTSEMDQPVGH